MTIKACCAASLVAATFGLFAWKDHHLSAAITSGAQSQRTKVHRPTSNGQTASRLVSLSLIGTNNLNNRKSGDHELL